MNRNDGKDGKQPVVIPGTDAPGDEAAIRLRDTLYVLASAIASTSAAERTLNAVPEERGIRNKGAAS